ncbi:MAG: hypothetical protein ACI4VW_06335 [Acutalibacteraceae bacterium]
MNVNELVISSIRDFNQWICDDLNVDVPDIAFVNADAFPTKTTIAVFNPDDGIVYYNLDYIPNTTFAESMYYVFFASAHELRHIYQYKNNDKAFAGHIPSSKTDLKSYNQQEVEADANKYAVKKMDEFNPDWDIYNIKETMKNENY